MLFTVVVPYYRTIEYLPDALESVFNQTNDDWECIVILDEYDEKAIRYLEGLSRSERRISIMSHRNYRNHGVSATRNLGILNAKGDYVAFLDADDLWAPNKLEVYASWIKEHDDAVMLYSKSIFIGDDSKIIVKNAGYITDGTGVSGYMLRPFEHMLETDRSIPTSSVVIKTSVLNVIGGFDETTGDVEDTLLWCQALYHGPVVFIPEILQSYRIHSRSWNASNDDMYQLSSRRLRMYWSLLDYVSSDNRHIVAQLLIRIGMTALIKKCGCRLQCSKKVVNDIVNVFKDARIKWRYKLEAGLVVVWSIAICIAVKIKKEVRQCVE